MKLYMFLILPCLIKLVLGIDENCLTEGECQLGFPVGDTLVKSSDECVAFCNDIEECLFFTYHNETDLCATYDSCPQTSTQFCPTCVSGSLDECYQCFKQGQCLGPVLTIEVADNAEVCLERCKTIDDCAWFSYNLEDGACILTTECTILDETCGLSCLYGAQYCSNPSDLPDANLIMIVGGENAPRDIEIIDFSVSGFGCAKPADLPVDIELGVGGFVDGNPIICGGIENTDCFKYSFELDEWTLSGSLDQLRVASKETLIDQESWWITGGADGPGLADQALNTTLIYQDGNLTQGPDLPIPLRFHCLVRINETHFFVAGGIDNSSPALNFVDRAFIYSFLTQTWTELPSMQEVRSTPSCGRAGTDIIVTGGWQGNSEPVINTEIYSLESGSWRIGPSLPTFNGGIRRSTSPLQLRNTFRIIGGYTGTEFLSEIFEYDPINEGWIVKKEELANPRDNSVVIPLFGNPCL